MAFEVKFSLWRYSVAIFARPLDLVESVAIRTAMGTMNTDAAIVPTNASDQGGLALASNAR